MDSSIENPINIWRYQAWQLALFACVLGILGLVFFDGLAYMVKQWEREEYSHGYILPFVALYFMWQKASVLATIRSQTSWLSVLIVAFGLFVYLVGELSTLFTVIQYGFLITLSGLLVAVLGGKGSRAIFVPFLILFFMVPLPNFLYNNLSASLQLISSELGVFVIRAFGISVFLEGNVIDLGDYKLQVVEACSGLRYLFPLAALGFIAAYVYKGAFWKKALIVLSTLPITVLMNSFRIGVIGVLVDNWGQSMAEGFLHDFEGWVVFMACAGLLVLEMWLLAKIGKNKMSLSEAFALDAPASFGADINTKPRRLSAPFYVSFVLIVLMAGVGQLLPNREEITPTRTDFAEYPMTIGEWRGTSDVLASIYLDVLKLNDYIMANYVNQQGATVNFYVAYYESQRKGESAHSPKSCMPGGGWELTDFGQHAIDNVNGTTISVNRTVIQLGEVKQLVYYWFPQRGRNLTSEYLVKWYLFWDSLTQSRTDGALVRLTSIVRPGQEVAEVDRILEGFIREAIPRLNGFVPE